uniref:SCP domain-containing protein n=1 Tax=Trichobilharzia regenti TaxID=157069 RepID=A0AA85J184_TRIRE|nr:unnamed protein product [Trichobilharzia regenti]
MHKVIFTSCLILQLVVLHGNAQETEETKTILEFHNTVRKAALAGKIPNQPKAKVMPPLTWNEKLAEIAQKHVDKCVLESGKMEDLYVKRYESVGQGVAEHISIQKLLETWYEEHKDYKFDTNECPKECGNYKQMVWATTKEIGCGTKLCGEKQMVVCNYGPGADDGKPYEKAGDSGEAGEE